jgi:hypothetical protein
VDVQSIGFRLVILSLAAAVFGCSSPGRETLETNGAPAAIAVEPGPASTTGPETTAAIADREFYEYIGAYVPVPEVRIDSVSRLPYAPYFAVTRLVYARQSEVRNSHTLASKCGAPEGKPEQGSDCAITYQSRGMTLSVEVVAFRSLASAQAYPATLRTGSTIDVDFNAGAYTTDADRKENDRRTARMIETAPIGTTFAMFIGPLEGRWVVVGRDSWASADSAGQLRPIDRRRNDSPPEWMHNATIDSVLDRIDRQTGK